MGKQPDGGQFVGVNDGKGPWAAAAYDVLLETAARYSATITYSDLAQEVQRRTGLETAAQQRNWIGKVLSIVVQRCHEDGTPPLTALVVHKHDGMVGTGYDEVLRVIGEPAQADQTAREEHAARARLECYRAYCPAVPEDAAPTLTKVYQAAIDRARQGRPCDPITVCPSCHLQVPVTGVCPNCC